MSALSTVSALLTVSALAAATVSALSTATVSAFAGKLSSPCSSLDSFNLWILFQSSLESYFGSLDPMAAILNHHMGTEESTKILF